jgi:hypothetical protein
MAPKKKKANKWETILQTIYNTPGKAGAFSSARNLQRVLREDYNLRISEEAIQNWLEGELAYTIHKPRRKVFPRNPIIATHIDNNWQADLAVMKKYKKFNKGFSYILVVIDVLSRFIWVEPLKSKDGPETTKAFENILKRASPRKPDKLQTDDGREFFNKPFSDLMKKYNIVHYSTESDQKAATVERANKTLKEITDQNFTSKQSYDWISYLQDIVKTYNNTFHSSIKMKPSQVTKENQKDVLKTLYGFIWEKDNIKFMHHRRKKFEVGQHVRLSKVTNVFKKGFEGYWTDKIFKVTGFQKRIPFDMYEVSELDGKKIGMFYDYELSRVNVDKDTYWRVEKILEKKFVKKKLMYLVKFMFYDEPMWIHASQIADVKDVGSKVK